MADDVPDIEGGHHQDGCSEKHRRRAGCPSPDHEPDVPEGRFDRLNGEECVVALGLVPRDVADQLRQLAEVCTCRKRLSPSGASACS